MSVTEKLSFAFSFASKKIHIHGPFKIALGAGIKFAFFMNEKAEILAFRVLLHFPGGRESILFHKIQIPINKDWKNNTIATICEELSRGDEENVGELVKFITAVTFIRIDCFSEKTKFFLDVKIPIKSHDKHCHTAHQSTKSNLDIPGFLSEVRERE